MARSACFDWSVQAVVPQGRSLRSKDLGAVEWNCLKNSVHSAPVEFSGRSTEARRRISLHFSIGLGAPPLASARSFQSARAYCS